MKSDSLLSWLFKKPEESLSLGLDICILLPLRVNYLAWRVLLRMLFGRERRNRSLFLQRLRLSDLFIPSFSVAKLTNNTVKRLSGSNQLSLVKITVPKYGYDYYCRLADFEPGREDDILQRFNPVEGQVVIDVGAHIGRYTLLSSKLVGPSGRVIAVEAHPYNFQMLKRNLDLNNMTNVTPFNCAAYSEDGSSLNLFLPGEDHGKTIYNTVMGKRATTEKSLSIPALKMDSIVRQAGIEESQVNWIKIDVEGAEYEVLKGAQNILSKSGNLSLLVEIHNLQNGNFYSEIMDLLAQNEFRIVYEQIYDGGERHVILRKRTKLTN